MRSSHRKRNLLAVAIVTPRRKYSVLAIVTTSKVVSIETWLLLRLVDGATWCRQNLLLTNQIKLTLTATLTLTDTVTVILFTRISLTPIKRLYRNNKRNFVGGAVAGCVRGPVFPHQFPVADNNSIVSSYLVVERGFFVGLYKKKGLGLLGA